MRTIWIKHVLPWIDRTTHALSVRLEARPFVLCLSLFAGMILTFPQPANAQTANEYMLKAVHFQTFGRYVTWPAESMSGNADSPFVIGILGNSPFGTLLDDLYASRKIQGRKVIIRYMNDISANDTSLNVLFISRSQRHRLGRIVDTVKDRPILTVADFDGAAKFGAHINFYVVGSNLKFEVNQKAAEKVGLKISFHLLRSARIVED